MIIVKHPDHENKLHLIIYDTELKDKILDEGEKIIDLSSTFYKGSEETDEYISNYFPKAFFIQAIGKNAVKLLQTYQDVEMIEEVNGIPYVFMMR